MYYWLKTRFSKNGVIELHNGVFIYSPKSLDSDDPRLKEMILKEAVDFYESYKDKVTQGCVAVTFLDVPSPKLLDSEYFMTRITSGEVHAVGDFQYDSNKLEEIGEWIIDTGLEWNIFPESKIKKDSQKPETKDERQYRFDKQYLRMAGIWANNSYCNRRKVGALLVKDQAIISDGYNGTPKGFPNVCEINDKTKPEVLHAEANAITKVAKSTNSSEGSTLYVTASPCIECSKLIIQAGIIRVVYRDKYHDESGIKLLEQAGIKVTQIEQKELDE